MFPRARRPRRRRHPFTIDPFYREMLLQGVDEVGLTRSLLPEIEAFEKDYARLAPWGLSVDETPC